jgi:hypothetical protein
MKRELRCYLEYYGFVWFVLGGVVWLVAFLLDVDW